MNTAHNHDRPMIYVGNPALDALEDRLQTNVTAYRAGCLWVVEANCTAVTGVGKTIEQAAENFTDNFFGRRA
jgi:hypothetical protein